MTHLPPSSEADAVEAEAGAIISEIGRLLAEWDRGESPLTATEFEDRCRELMGQSIELDKIREKHWQQRWALYFLKHSGVWLGEHA